VKRPRKRATGNICCLQALSKGTGDTLAESVFAAGTTSGWVSIYRVVPGYAHVDELQLLAECQPHKGLKADVLGAPSAAVRTMEFSADGSQLLVCHENGQVQMFQIHGSAEEEILYIRPLGPANLVSHRDPLPVKLLQATLRLSFVEFMRPLSDLRFSTSNRARNVARKEHLKASEEWYFVETATFHPSLTFSLGHASIMCGCRNGTIVKFNLRAKDVFFLPTVATFEPPYVDGVEHGAFRAMGVQEQLELSEAARMRKRNSSKGMKVDARKFIRREFFEGHSARIICLAWTTAAIPTMVSVDETGLILEWVYTEEYFSGFGWFNPARRYKFDLRTAPGAVNVSHGGAVTLLSAYVCLATNELHLFTARGDTAHLTIADLQSGRLWPALIRVPGPTVSSTSSSSRRKDSDSPFSRSSLQYVPGLEASQADYFYIMAGRFVRIFSLALGNQVRQHPVPQDFRKPFMCVVGQGHIVIADGSKEMFQLYQVEVAEVASIQKRLRKLGATDVLDALKRHQFRLERSHAEFRQRIEGQSEWDIAEQHARHEIQKIVYEIADAAMDEILDRNALGVFE